MLANGREYLEKWGSHLQIYTDGTKCEEKSTCVFHVPELKIQSQYRLSDYTSMFDSELVAILKALQWLEGKPLFLCLFLSDCLSAPQALQGESE